MLALLKIRSTILLDRAPRRVLSARADGEAALDEPVRQPSVERSRRLVGCRRVYGLEPRQPACEERPALELRAGARAEIGDEQALLEALLDHEVDWVH